MAEAAGPSNPKFLEASAEECHGHCYTNQAERLSWHAPKLMVVSDIQARTGYNTVDASEYEDTPETLRRKVKFLADLLRQSRRPVLYSGAGLSTASGIGDYASKAPDSLSGSIEAPGPEAPGQRTSFLSPLTAQPSQAHRCLVALHKAGFMYRWVNQNHDGLPQKAGLPQSAINEIHGAWHAPDNPVIQMSGSLRDDLFQDLADIAETTDLAIAVGTSLCGMNADRIVEKSAKRAAKQEPGHLGSVIVCLQRTVHDKEATLRIFARCDDVFTLLAEEMGLEVSPPLPEGTFYVPPVLVDLPEADYIFKDVKYGMDGEKSEEETTTWDLRDEAELVICRGLHAGATGVVDGFDREGNLRCRFTLRPPKGKLRAPMTLILGRWWIQGAVEGSAPTLPCVNPPPVDTASPSGKKLLELMAAYAK